MLGTIAAETRARCYWTGIKSKPRCRKVCFLSIQPCLRFSFSLVQRWLMMFTEAVCHDATLTIFCPLVIIVICNGLVSETSFSWSSRAISNSTLYLSPVIVNRKVWRPWVILEYNVWKPNTGVTRKGRGDIVLTPSAADVWGQFQCPPWHMIWRFPTSIAGNDRSREKQRAWSREGLCLGSTLLSLLMSCHRRKKAKDRNVIFR